MPRRPSVIAAAAAVVLAAAAGIAAVRSGDGGGEAAHPAAVGGKPVVGRSTRVGGTGVVYWLRDDRPRFCAESGDSLPECDDMFVWVEGVDRERLTGLRVEEVGAGTVTWGTAYLEGEVRDDTLHVDHQGPPRPRPDDTTKERLAETMTVPCPAPRGGWPVGSPNADSRYRELRGNTDFVVGQYPYLQPGNVVRQVRRYATPERPVIVLVVRHPERVPAGIRNAGGAVCVVRSRYTLTQVAAAERAAERWSLANRARAILGEAKDAQARVALYVPVLTPEVAAFVAAQPAGLVEPVPWLVPVE
ncbi:MAG TPA: hypothetical protein VF519_08920 [Mycobacteriales bacterium]|jgi:hypothetical protein